MKHIALTGSIGMGKSATLNMFKKKHIPIFDSDMAVHTLYDKDGEGTKFIAQLFPTAISDGKVDRAHLSKIVMEDPSALKKIEDALHPMVHQMQAAFIEENKDSPFVVMDIPLLFETGKAKNFDKVIVVSAPQEVQRERVLARDGMSAEKFEKIKSLQMPDAEKRAKADFIIETDKGFEHAEACVDEIIQELKS